MAGARRTRILERPAAQRNGFRAGIEELHEVVREPRVRAASAAIDLAYDDVPARRGAPFGGRAGFAARIGRGRHVGCRTVRHRGAVGRTARVVRIGRARRREEGTAKHGGHRGHRLPADAAAPVKSVHGFFSTLCAKKESAPKWGATLAKLAWSMRVDGATKP